MECDFGTSNTICIIGHCDAGKTTILTSISFLFSNGWTVPVSDEDFHNQDIETPIRISGVIADAPSELLTFDKYGLHQFSVGNGENVMNCIELVLTIEKDLEPRWEVHNRNSDEYHTISHKERSLFKIRLIDDYFDSQFNMSKYSILKNLVENISGKGSLTNNISVELIREIRSKLKVGENTGMPVTEKLNQKIQQLGGEEREFSLAVPMDELILKGNQIGLHADNIPIRLLGKGTRRQLSIALQLSTNDENTSAILIDEVEQGLEPYKVKTIARALKDADSQVFMTTHSSMVLAELDADDIFYVQHGASSLIHLDSHYQQLLRTNPDAFFFNKIIMCEGETEYGFLLELDRYLWKSKGRTISSYSASPIIGKGDNMLNYAPLLSSLGADVLCFIDNDKPNTVSKLDKLCAICSCDSGNSIEQQIYRDAPDSVLANLIDDAIAIGKLNKSCNFETYTRERLGSMSKDGKWYKNVGRGRYLGELLFSHCDEIPQDAHLRHQIDIICKWLNGEQL